MTANPDSALRQALVAAEKALATAAERFATIARGSSDIWCQHHAHRGETHAREAHALITEALAQSNAEGET